MSGKLLTTALAAAELTITAEQVRRLVQDGELHPINVGRTGKRQSLRFETDDIESFKKRRSVKGKGSPPWQQSRKTKGRNISKRTSGSTVVSFLAQQDALRKAKQKSEPPN